MKFDFPDLLFDSGAHHYSLDSDPSVKITSVTQIVKEFSRVFDADREAAKYAAKHQRSKQAVLAEWDEKLERAGALGTAVHDCAEHMVLEAVDRGYFVRPLFAIEKCYHSAVYKFCSEHIELLFQPMLPEIRVYHPNYQIAGTVDLVCYMDGVPTILDWKTSGAMDMFGYNNMYAPFNKLPDSNYWHFVCQLNIYSKVLADVYNFVAEKLVVVWLGKDGEYRLFNIPDISELVVKALDRRRRKLLKKERQ